MLKFISFGSGSSGNCYYLYSEHEGLLIDVGVGTRILKKQFHDYGLNFTKGFNAILVTHDHADHIKSVGSLCQKFDIPVYASELVHSGMDRNYCMKRKISHSNRRYVVPGKKIAIGNFHITPFSVPHDSSENIGYSIEYEGIVFSLLTDVGHITDEMNVIMQKTNYIVIEANYDPQKLEDGPYPRYLKDRIKNGTGHLSNQQCGNALTENYTKKLKHIWLCHLSEENNNPDIAKSCVEKCLSDSHINVGFDLNLDVLKRKSPTGIFELI